MRLRLLIASSGGASCKAKGHSTSDPLKFSSSPPKRTTTDMNVFSLRNFLSVTCHSDFTEGLCSPKFHLLALALITCYQHRNIKVYERFYYYYIQTYFEP